MRHILFAVPKWRNWQTRQVQGLVGVRSWEFDSPLRHHTVKHNRSLILLKSISRAFFFFGPLYKVTVQMSPSYLLKKNDTDYFRYYIYIPSDNQKALDDKKEFIKTLKDSKKTDAVRLSYEYNGRLPVSVTKSASTASGHFTRKVPLIFWFF